MAAEAPSLSTSTPPARHGSTAELLMKIVIASDSFKGSLSAPQAVAAICAGVRQVFPAAEIVPIPVADGGEGTVRALCNACGGKYVQAPAHDPLGRAIQAEYALLPDGTAVVETAAASGLTLLRPDERDALRASSFGTGELIRHALFHGAQRLILSLGGSATTDGGAGLMQALGAAFLDETGAPLPAGGAALARLERIDLSALLPQARSCHFLLASDVHNPLTGPQGAAAVFSPQKGASPAQAAALDAALTHYAAVLSHQLGSDAAQRPGSGAAGGIGCAMLAFFDAELRPGIDLVLDAAGFDAAVADADLVLTGEGQLDAQSACGKVPSGVARRAKAVRDVPVIAIGGAIAPGAEALYPCGIDGMAAAVSRVTSLARAMQDAAAALEDCTARTMRLLRIGTHLRANC